MAYSIRHHLQKLASPKNISELCISRNETKSPLSQSTQIHCTPLNSPVTNNLRVIDASQNATKSPITGMCSPPSRISTVRKMEWGSEFTPPRKSFHNLSCGLNENSRDCGDKLVLIDTPQKIALSSDGLNSKKHWVKLGIGSFGTVIQAIYKGEDVAVKVIPKKRFKKSLGSLRNECNALKLHHPNVVRVLQVIDTEGDYGLVFMGLCNGINLQSMISDPMFAINSACRTRYVLDIAHALQYCHNSKILHLDVKPNNIMVCLPEDYCKLCDFGSSHVLGKDYCTGSPSVNTVMYTDPHILQGKLPSEKSDVYSLGITSWQLLSREVPYEGYTLHAIIYKVGCGTLRPKSMQDVKIQDDGFINLYQLCWHQNPNNRPTICTVIHELKRIIANLNTFSAT